MQLNLHCSSHAIPWLLQVRWNQTAHVGDVNEKMIKKSKFHLARFICKIEFQKDTRQWT